MTQLVGPPLVLDAAAPEPPEYRLLDTALTTSSRALLGGNIFSYPPGKARLYPACAEGTFAEKDLDNPWDSPAFLPFGIYYPVQCSAIDLRREEVESRARAAFLAVESEAVERELLAGIAQPTNPYLSDSNVDVFGQGGPVQGLALLERAIAQTGRKGMIHADPAVASAWGISLETEGAVARTILGTPVVVGQGYGQISGGGVLYPPAGGDVASTDSSGWAYATGPVQVFRGPIQVLFGFDQTVNDQVAIVEREYLVVWDTQLQAAVLIDFSTTP